MESPILGQNHVDVDGTFGLNDHKRSGHRCERTWRLDGRRLGQRCIGRVGWWPEAVGFVLLWESLNMVVEKDSHPKKLGMVWKASCMFFLQKRCSKQLKVRLLLGGKCSKQFWDTAESVTANPSSSPRLCWKRCRNASKPFQNRITFCTLEGQLENATICGESTGKDSVRGRGVDSGLAVSEPNLFSNTSLQFIYVSSAQFSWNFGSLLISRYISLLLSFETMGPGQPCGVCTSLITSCFWYWWWWWRWQWRRRSFLFSST